MCIAAFLPVHALCTTAILPKMQEVVEDDLDKLFPENAIKQKTIKEVDSFEKAKQILRIGTKK